MNDPYPFAGCTKFKIFYENQILSFNKSLIQDKDINVIKKYFQK